MILIRIHIWVMFAKKQRQRVWNQILYLYNTQYDVFFHKRLLLIEMIGSLYKGHIYCTMRFRKKRAKNVQLWTLVSPPIFIEKWWNFAQSCLNSSRIWGLFFWKKPRKKCGKNKKKFFLREDFFETTLDLRKHPQQVFWFFPHFFLGVFFKKIILIFLRS